MIFRRGKDFHWHDLRHTFASRLAMAGVPIRTLADLMGHTEVQTTTRYAHLARGYLAEAVKKLAPSIAATEASQTDTATGTEVLELSPVGGQSRWNLVAGGRIELPT